MMSPLDFKLQKQELLLKSCNGKGLNVFIQWHNAGIQGKSQREHSV
jgi:hypothetical protein